MSNQSADRLSTFVPRLAVEMAATAGNRHSRIDGSMLSADISGFTALSERLAAKGRAGAEEITDLINTCFDALITDADERGGEILKFGGDAILVLFRGDDHALRCAAAGLAMQQSLADLTAARNADLTMTVGAHTGQFDCFLVGTTHRELFVAGADATTVIDLEGAAGKSETLVSPQILAAVPSLSPIGAHDGGHVISGRLVGPKPGFPVARNNDDTLFDLVPSAITSQLAGVLSLGGEHRHVGVCFVQVGGVTERIETVGAETVADELAALIDHVMEACNSFGTAFLHSDIAPHGVKLVITAGAPVSHGDEADAVLHTALRIAEADTAFVLRLGIQVGRIFAGFLGSDERRAYTVMGDAVNTAARMLGRAGDRDVIAMDDVVAQTRMLFRTEELEPFTVKGKSEPVIAHHVVAVSDETRRETRQAPLLGRDRELAELSGAIESDSRAVELSGAAGLGKSRLLDGFLADFDGEVLRGSCSHYGTASPYSAFRPMVRRAIGLDLHTDADTAGDVLTKVVDDVAPHLEHMLPLLAIPFGAEVPATPEAEAIDPEHRRARLHDAVGELLDAIHDRHLLVVLEDVHWIDEASADLVAHLADHVDEHDWSVVVSTRRPGSWRPGDDRTFRLELGEIDDRAIRQLAIDASTRSLGDHQLDEIVRRAGGNPLFAIELARALGLDADAVLPDSVERLMANRIDQLEPSSRLLVRLAAVLGAETGIDQLEAVLAAEAPGLTPDRNDLAGILEVRAGNRIGFTHGLYRDAAYEGLPYRHRRRLHRVVAEFLEQRFVDQSSAGGEAALLALHFSEARVHAKAWLYGVLAGDLARLQWANSDAAAAYERALASSRWDRTIEPEVIVRVATALSDCRLAIGDLAGARDALQRARRANEDRTTAADLMRRLGVLAERTGATSQAIRWYTRARRLLPEQMSDKSMLLVSSALRLAHGGIYHRRGDNVRCLEMARQALDEARAAGEPASEARALHRLHLATVYLRWPDTERFGPRALALFEKLEDHERAASVLNNLGIEAYFNGDWTEAIDCYARSATECERAGNTLDLALAKLNTAELLSEQGHWERAADLFADAGRNFASAGYSAGLGANDLFSGVNERRQERWAEAEHLIQRALDRFRDLGLAELEDDAESRLVELAMFRGHADLDRIDALLARFGEQHPLSRRMRWIRAITLCTVGRTSEGITELRALLPESEGVELARTSEVLIELCPDDADAEEWKSTMEEEYRRAGVVVRPHVPIGDHQKG